MKILQLPTALKIQAVPAQPKVPAQLTVPAAQKVQAIQ